MEVWLTWRGLNARCGVATEEWKAVHMEELIQRSKNVTLIIGYYYYYFFTGRKNVFKKSSIKVDKELNQRC